MNVHVKNLKIKRQPVHWFGLTGPNKTMVIIVGNPNRKKMHIFGFVGIFEYICKTTFNIMFNMCTKP